MNEMGVGQAMERVWYYRPVSTVPWFYFDLLWPYFFLALVNYFVLIRLLFPNFSKRYRAVCSLVFALVILPFIVLAMERERHEFFVLNIDYLYSAASVLFLVLVSAVFLFACSSWYWSLYQLNKGNITSLMLEIISRLEKAKKIIRI